MLKKKKKKKSTLSRSQMCYFYMCPLIIWASVVEYRDERHSQMVISAISFGQAFQGYTHARPFGPNNRNYGGARMNRFFRKQPPTQFFQGLETNREQGAKNAH